MAHIEGMTNEQADVLKKVLEEMGKENSAISSIFYKQTDETDKAAKEFRRKVEELSRKIDQK